MAKSAKELVEAANAVVPLKELGYGEVTNLGAFGDWADNGGAVDK